MFCTRAGTHGSRRELASPARFLSSRTLAVEILNTSRAETSKAPHPPRLINVTDFFTLIMTSQTILALLAACSVLTLTQCAKPQTVYNKKGEPVATTLNTPTGSVTTQKLGNSTVVTRRLINHPLTNADCGKVYEEVTVVSPAGTSVQQRIIVRALPRLQIKNVTKR